MKSMVFSVYDSACEAYLPIFIAPTVGYAMRMFKDASIEGGKFHDHAADFTLFQIGTWDDSGGIMDGSMVNKSLGNALEIQATRGE